MTKAENIGADICDFFGREDQVRHLRVFLTTSHPKMPNLILTPEEIADVSAYILSLRHRPPS